MMLRVTILSLLVASAAAAAPPGGVGQQCVGCDCMKCVGSTDPYKKDDGQWYKKVDISASTCAEDGISWMCCTNTRTPDTPFGDPGSCTQMDNGSCDANKCEGSNGISVYTAEVPVAAYELQMLAHHGVFIAGGAIDNTQCGNGNGGNPGQGNGGNFACSDGSFFPTGICDTWIDLSECSSDGNGIGDPHFQAWGGQWYDFHGACDLVFLSNPSFKDNLGLDVHIRTTLRDDFSYIEAAAVRIGEDVLEVTGWGEYMLNGVETAEFPFTVGGYQVEYTKVSKKKYRFDIFYATGQGVRIQTVKDLVNVQMVNASMFDFQDSVGLMGHFGSNQLLSRDGKTNYFLKREFDTFGMEWQVQPDEPQLFDAPREPQAPTQCVMPLPKSEQRKSRRLGESSVTPEQAKRACAEHFTNEQSMKMCISDVLALDDLEVADAGAF